MMSKMLLVGYKLLAVRDATWPPMDPPALCRRQDHPDARHQARQADCPCVEGAKPVTEHFSRWDTAEGLKTEEDIGHYLQACMEEAGDDPAFIAKALAPLRERAA